MHHAIEQAVELNMECVQVFTANQRQWKPKPPGEDAIATWLKTLEQAAIQQTVSHDSYLVNLANGKEESREKSVALLRSELERCESLSIPFCVAHPGAHLGDGEDVGLSRIAAQLDRIHQDLSGYQVKVCLEITAGQGTNLGYKFEHLRDIINQVADPERLAVCLDTAHLLAAGYDLTSGKGAKQVIKECDDIVGLERVQVLHLNDSKTERGSRVDRHEHIGHGHVSLEAFAEIVNHKAFANIPKILETPKADHPDGQTWDEVNLQTLRDLIR